MKNFLYIPLILVAFASCRKDNKNVVQPNQPTSTTSTTTATTKYPTEKMNGNWIWMGSSSVPYFNVHDAFDQFSVTVINDSTVIIQGNTLRYRSFDSTTMVLTYGYQDSYFSLANLHFNIVDYTMVYYYSNKYVIENLSTNPYKTNSSLKDYMPFITGAKNLSGIAYDTLLSRSPTDSLYTIDTTIDITSINDSTIVVDKDFLDIGNNTLHYKQTDFTAKTVQFQTLHPFTNSISILTYNYVNKSIVFEQHYITPNWNRHLKLQ